MRASHGVADGNFKKSDNILMRLYAKASLRKKFTGHTPVHPVRLFCENLEYLETVAFSHPAVGAFQRLKL